MRRRRRRLLAAGMILASILGAPPAAPAAVTPSLCAIRYPSDAGVAWECRRLRSGQTLESLFGDRWIDVARFNRTDRRHARAGVALKVPTRLEDIAEFTPMPAEYPDAAGEPKFILVDLTEQFLGAYEHGRLVRSAPIASGEIGNETPRGGFRITGAHRRHQSSRYTIEGTDTPYPMHWALRFHVSAAGDTYWIHGRDLPGYPASHGCIGLFDEAMQTAYYGEPSRPVLDDARLLYEWAVGSVPDDDRVVELRDGPKMLIVGRTPAVPSGRGAGLDPGQPSTPPRPGAAGCSPSRRQSGGATMGDSFSDAAFAAALRPTPAPARASRRDWRVSPPTARRLAAA